MQAERDRAMPAGEGYLPSLPLSVSVSSLCPLSVSHLCVCDVWTDKLEAIGADSILIFSIQNTRM